MKKNDKPAVPDSALDKEIRRDRKFSLEEALARRAAGALKGASPVTRADQALLEIKDLLETQLSDGEGSLARTVLALIAENYPLLARHYDQPSGALREFLAGIMAHTTALADLVGQTDARWGRDYQERPHFEDPGQIPHPEDPYTLASVRQALADLQDILNKL